PRFGWMAVSSAPFSSRPLPAKSRLGGLECQGCRVDAIAQPRRRRPVVKDVAQVRITPFAGYRHTHAPAVVFGFRNVLFGDRLPEARPAGTGIELRLRRKQGRATANAAKH